MGFLDRFRQNKMVAKATDVVGDAADKAGDVAGSVGDKVGDAAGKVGDVVAEGVDKATDFIDDKTGGKMHDALEKVDNVADKLRGDEEEDGDDASDSAEG